MVLKTCWIFVEGGDDLFFIQEVIQPYLASKCHVKIWSYAERTKESRQNFLRTLQSPTVAQQMDYWIVIDMERDTCFGRCRERALDMFGHLPDADRIICVNRAIEAWYAAGFVGSRYFKRLSFSQCEGLHGDEFDAQLERAGYSLARRLEILTEMLANYDFELARQRSSSLDYFCRKLGL